MPPIALLFFPGCPHIEAARHQLRRACDVVGRPATWVELDVTAPDAPAHTRGFGSPTILVDGRDVTGAGPGAAASSCRVYAGTDVAGAPPLQAVVQALRGLDPEPLTGL